MTDRSGTTTGAVDRAMALPARVGGAALATAVRGLKLARSDEKPLHPRGDYFRGTVTRFGGGDSGVPWLDDSGTDETVVRMSRAIGLPRPWPDVCGIALRLKLGDGEADLLFATTGWGRLTRFLLTAAWKADQQPYTTLLPYRTPQGPVVLGLRPDGDGVFHLERAFGTGAWTPFGRLVLDGPYAGPALSFDPIAAPVPGLPPYAWVAALRRPSYRTAQKGRSGTAQPTPGDHTERGGPV